MTPYAATETRQPATSTARHLASRVDAVTAMLEAHALRNLSFLPGFGRHRASPQPRTLTENEWLGN